MSIILVDSLYKEDVIDKTYELSQSMKDFEIVDFVCDRKNILASTRKFFSSLKGNVVVRGSYYSLFVESLFSKSPFFDPTDLLLLEENCFYFFLDRKNVVAKDKKKAFAHRLLYMKSNLPIKIKLFVDMDNTQEAMKSFDTQYEKHLLKTSGIYHTKFSNFL